MRGQRRLYRRAGVALVACLVAVPTLAVPALAADVPTPGVAYPGPVIQRPTAALVSSSEQHFLLAGGQAYDELDPRSHFSVVNRSDGTEVYSYDIGPENGAELPALVGSALVRELRPVSSQGSVEVRSATTGVLEASIFIGGTELVRADSQWALVGDSAGPETGDRVLRIIRADETSIDVPGTFSSTPTWAGGDAATAYISAWEGSYSIDTATGEKTLLPFPDGARVVAVTATEVIGSATGYVDGVKFTKFRSLDRSDLTPAWSADVPTDYRSEGFVVFGDGIAQKFRPDDALAPAYEHLQLRPVDLATGELTEPVASSVYRFVQLPAGEVALVFADTPGGRLVIARQDGLEEFGDLPDHNEMALDVGLSGTTLATSWSERDGVWQSDLGAGAWADALPDPQWQVNDGDKQVAFAGDVVMTTGARVNMLYSYRFQWPGGSRSMTANDAVLGHGGMYALRFLYSGLERTEVIDVRTGDVVRTYPELLRRHIDGTWLWDEAVDADGLLEAIDLTGALPPRSVQLPASCANADVIDVRGRWALMYCGKTVVVDLERQVPDFQVPTGGNGYRYLGNGFYVLVKPISGTSYPLGVFVSDVVTGETRLYGHVRGNSYPPGIGVAVNDAGTPDLAYIDTTYQVRHVELDWLAVASETPVFVAGPTLDPVVASTTSNQVDLSWSWLNASSYDVRRGDATGTDWTLPADWQGLTEATVSASIPAGTSDCFSARARDAEGVAGPWTEAVCQYVDGAAPTLDTPTGSPRFPSKLRDPVTFAASATDDDVVASYDVERRTALRGKGLGAWSRLVDAGAAAAITTGPQTPGSEFCFRARARDRAGNVSPWSASRCTTAPVDSTELVVGNATVVKRSSTFIGGSLVRYAGKGNSAILKAQTGRTIALWIQRGPGLGSADVYAAGRYVGRISFAATTSKRALVLLPVSGGFSGNVSVVARSASPVQVDAIAVER